MLTFRSRYNFTLEKNGRLNIPSKFIKAFSKVDEDERQLVLTRGIDKCIFAYPADRWYQIEKEIMKKDFRDESVRYQIRELLINATEVGWDKQGRINIPAHLLEWAGVKKDVLIFGVIDKIEIWEKTEYDKYINDFESKSKISESITKDLFMVPADE